jgi:hypothetical protein
MQKSNCVHQMMINVTIREEKDGKYKLTWRLEVNDNTNDPQESLHETYEEASEKALQLVVAANPGQTRLTDYGGI